MVRCLPRRSAKMYYLNGWGHFTSLSFPRFNFWDKVQGENGLSEIAQQLSAGVTLPLA